MHPLLNKANNFRLKQPKNCEKCGTLDQVKNLVIASPSSIEFPKRKSAKSTEKLLRIFIWKRNKAHKKHDVWNGVGWA